MLQLTRARISREAIAEFFQKCGMLLEAGYDVTSACELLTERTEKQHDRSTDGIARVAELLLPDLRDGFPLYIAMEKHPKYFSAYIKQVEIGDEAGRLSAVLKRLFNEIKNTGRVETKLKSAVAYPLAVLIFTIAAAVYLFSNVVPDLLRMLKEVGVNDVPTATQIVARLGNWVNTKGMLALSIILAAAFLLTVYSRTAGKVPMSALASRLPLIGPVICHNAVSLFYRSWEQMLSAGAEMSVAMRSAAETVKNAHISRQLLSAYEDYTLNGTPVHKTLAAVDAVRGMELKSLQVALESGQLTETLDMLSKDREYEAETAVSRMTAAVNPILMVLVGLFVGLIVMAIYGPIISVTSSPIM